MSSTCSWQYFCIQTSFLADNQCPPALKQMIVKSTSNRVVDVQLLDMIAHEVTAQASGIYALMYESTNR